MSGDTDGQVIGLLFRCSSQVTTVYLKCRELSGGVLFCLNKEVITFFEQTDHKLK